MQKDFEIDFGIYSKKLLIQAIEDFHEIAKIELKWNLISIDMDDKINIDECFNELMNYCIWLNND